MATVRQRSGLRGVSEFRKALRTLPLSMRKEIGMVVAETAINVQADMYQFVPKESGITGSNIESKMSSDKLSARVGFLKQQDQGTSSAGFVARFIEYGTKGAPERNIPPQTARPFIAPAADVNETAFRESVQDVLRRVLRGSKIGKAFGYG